jgi:cellulose synthase/poly-beta-1,6-N-acetylglucosamine synthase-like glycosyltransferase
MNILYTIFVTVLWFLSTYFAVVILLTMLTKKKKIFEAPRFRSLDRTPLVTILVPVYNEGKKVKETLDSLKKVDYPKDKLEIIILNDGSKDNTSEIVRQNLGPRMTFVDNKKNKGKAATLNQGIELAKGEFIATMDGDSEVPSDIITQTIPHFANEKVGAVTVTVEVKDPQTLLQKIIEIEYIIGLHLMLRILSLFGALHVTPGPFSVYRKKAFDDVGVYDVDNIVEDHEIAMRMQTKGWKIANCNSTRVRTISPGTFKELYVQRKRWYTGSLLTLWQYRGKMFKKETGMLGFVYPYTYILITGGLLLFSYSLYLMISKAIQYISYYSLTNFNFFAHFSLQNIDLLTMGALSVLGVAAIMTTILTETIALVMTKNPIRKRIPGFIGFIFLFFLYQIFWGSSFVSAITRKKVKWR